MDTDQTPENDHVDESDPLELTPRELAIAAGEDPDAIADDGQGDVEPQDAVDTESAAGDEGDEVEQSPHDDAMVARATAAGLSADDVKEFGSPAALRLHVELLEKIAGLGQKPDAAETPAEETPAADADDDILDPAEFAGTEDEPGYGELEMKLVNAVRKLQEERVEFRRFVQEQRQQSIASQFDDAVDRLDDERLGFTRDERGRRAEVTPEQRNLREKIFAEADRLYAEQVASARNSGSNEPVPVRWGELVSQAKAVVLPAEKKVPSADALKKQSARRRPVSSGAGAAVRASTVDEDDPVAIARSPEVVRFWKKIEAENGY